MDLTLPPKQYTSLEQRNMFDRNLLQSVMSLPGVESAALGNGGMPYSNWRSSYSFEGQPSSDDRKIIVSLISSQYPQTLGIPLKRGREFTEAELENGMHVALINESAARLWPSGEDPTGRHMQIDALIGPTPESVFKAA
jgi:hypothetical protein